MFEKKKKKKTIIIINDMQRMHVKDKRIYLKLNSPDLFTIIREAETRESIIQIPN